MAIYHFSAKIIGRSSGRSAVASAAYRAAEMLHDEKLGRDFDYTAKAGVIHSEIILPDGAPERLQDRATLWNEVDAGEKRKDAQLARDIELSLPREMSRPEAIALARDFVREQFVARGMVADLNVHWTKAGDGEDQPHAHVLLTMRQVKPDGFGRKETGWNDRALLKGWRERWAEVTNERLAMLGYDVHVDHRSFADQGIDLEAQNKIGAAGARREDRGEPAERAAEHRAIAQRNGERLLQEPEIALRALTHQQSTFTRQDLARFVSRNTDGAEQFATVLAKVQASPELVSLGVDERDRERLTTRDMLATERRMERAAGTIAGRGGHRMRGANVDKALAKAAHGGLVLGDDQRAAFEHVTTGPDLAAVVGYAGTGKSAMFAVAREAWEAAGYRVRGAALSGIAAEGFEAGSGIPSRTIASLENAWNQGRDELTRRDVLVIDEAGMVGSRQMDRVLAAVEKARAKVVVVGDPEQLQAIQAGAAFRALVERHGAAEISIVRRQRVEWQQDATKEFATSRTSAALERYAAAGMVHAAETQPEARAALVAGWDTVRQQSPSTTQIILTYTRDDVADLNGRARERMRATGELHGADQVVQTERGERPFAAGDRIMFLRNERGLGAGPNGKGGVKVKNGTLGTVQFVSADGGNLTVQLDGSGKRTTFSAADYADFDHGYAATVHKAQGVTVDRAHVLATPHMDRHAAYVALTRHRDGVTVHYSSEDFADRERLARTLGRERAKDTSLDYDGPDRLDAIMARRYADRRGFTARQDQARPRAASRFARLKLDASRLPDAPAPASRDRQTPLAAFVEAWADGARMVRDGLPVLPHQQEAIRRAAGALDAVKPGLARDVGAALDHNPRLARQAATDEGARALTRAAETQRAARTAREQQQAQRAAQSRGYGLGM